MRRFLTLAIACAALAQGGPVALADDDWDDDRDDARERGDDWHGHPGQPGGHHPYHPYGDRSHPAYGYGHWHYHQSGSGPGVWIHVPPETAPGAPSGSSTVATRPEEASASGIRHDHWLGDMTLYENDDPVPAPMSLAPVSTQDAPPDPNVPPAPARPHPHSGRPAFGSEVRPFSGDPSRPLESQGRLEPIPDERFQFRGPGPAADPALTLKPGEFATGPVPLYQWVSVDATRNIAPGAMPVVVAVRHPQICPFPCRCHREQVAFAQVWVPRWPARRIKVEKHGTRVELDYGSHQVKVESAKGRVKVEYED